MRKNKHISTIAILRAIRDEFNERYYKNPELLVKDLRKINKKYHLQDGNIKKLKIA